MKFNGFFKLNGFTVAVVVAVAVVAFDLNLDPKDARSLLIQWPPTFSFWIFIRGCSHIMSAAGGGEGVGQKMTVADKGG